MEDLLQVLSSLVSDRVRHFELVKIKNDLAHRKAYILVADGGLHLVTCSLGGLLKGGRFMYDCIKRVEKRNNVITLHFTATPGLPVESLDIAMPSDTHLYAKIKVAMGANHMRYHYEEAESSSDEGSDDTSDTEVPERTLLPFRGYKKVTLRGYFFFMRDSFEHTSFTSGSLMRLQDVGRGMSINVNIREPMPVHSPHLESPQNLHQYTRGFLNDLGLVEVLVDGYYNKRMNLNNDLATWSCYHVLVKTESSLLAYFIFRRLYMPPMFDICQDISMRFEVPLSSVEDKHLSVLYNEICTTANSLTPVDEYNVWYKDLIQARLDTLRFNHTMYAFMKRKGSIVPSYNKLIKGFILSALRLLPRDCVDPHVIQAMKDPMALTSDDPMDYIYHVKALVFGIGDADESPERRELMNRFDMRLADYIAICIDELLMGSHLSLAVFTRYLNAMPDDAYKKKLYEVTAYLVHFRSNDFNEDYSSSLLNKIIESYRVDIGHYISNAHFSKRMIEEGFFIHQYAEDLRHRDGKYNPYLTLVSDILEQCRGDIIVERVLKKFLDIPQPIDASYLPLLKCLIGMLRRNVGNYKIVMIITAILTNFSFHSAAFKDHMIRHGIASVLIDNMLSSEEQIVLSTLKLMINITKATEHQQEFISQGVMSNFISLLEVQMHHGYRYITFIQTYCGRHMEIVSLSAGVLGQLFNYKLLRMTANQIFRLEFITEVMIFSFHIGSADPNHMVMIMFCLKKVPKTGPVYIKIGKHVIRSIMLNLKVYSDDDFVVNALELLLELSKRVQNCIVMRHIGILDAIAEVPLNDTLVQIANKLKERVTLKTRCVTLKLQ
ncbi:ARM repeat containing protein, putative [Babesia ovata]|uniref:ARM repeat containing protein, putative n=1 Tax=Babesia ovata TaxID=189622 RepID=A0A2H6KIB0_9APIC|nr:ARM repeat containing protein, putative [Babesia ovata]GBE62732.1 ARM repeat containing protein, putative [Babesia ovata]